MCGRAGGGPEEEEEEEEAALRIPAGEPFPPGGQEKAAAAAVPAPQGRYLPAGLQHQAPAASPQPPRAQQPPGGPSRLIPGRVKAPRGLAVGPGPARGMPRGRRRFSPRPPASPLLGCPCLETTRERARCEVHLRPKSSRDTNVGFWEGEAVRGQKCKALSRRLVSGFGAHGLE